MKLHTCSDNESGHGRDDGDTDSKSLGELLDASLGPGLGVKRMEIGSRESGWELWLHRLACTDCKILSGDIIRKFSISIRFRNNGSCKSTAMLFGTSETECLLTCCL